MGAFPSLAAEFRSIPWGPKVVAIKDVTPPPAEPKRLPAPKKGK